MQLESCPRESEILNARKESLLPPDLLAHASGCPVCAETLAIREFLEMEPETTVAPPGLIYWKAELRARRERAEEALRPARRMEIAAIVAIAGIAIGGSAVYGTALIWMAAAGFTAMLAGSAWAIRSWLKER